MVNFTCCQMDIKGAYINLMVRLMVAIKPATKNPGTKQIADLFTGGYFTINNQLRRDFLDYCKDELNYSESTIKGYSALLRLYVNYLGNTDIQSLKITDVQAYFKHRLTKNTQTSVNRDRSLLRAFFLYVDKVREIRLLFDYSMIRNAKVDEPETKFITLEQFQKILNILEEEQDRLIFSVMFVGALRISEVCTLSVGDVSDGELRIKGKGGKRRLVPVPTDLTDRLQQFLYDTNRSVGAVFRHAVSKRTVPNTAYTPNGLRKRLYRLGVPVNPHAARHGMATLLANNNLDIRSLQVFLGHKRIDTTQRYWHVTDPQLREKIQKHTPTGLDLRGI